MINAVDTSVLLDVFTADPVHGPPSRHALERCLSDGSLVACEVVFAELAGAFGSSREALASLEVLGVAFSPCDALGALAAGTAWRSYRRRGGRRTRVIADFLIGAHAATAADRLLTRDRGFYRTYFAELTVIDPAAG